MKGTNAIVAAPALAGGQQPARGRAMRLPALAGTGLVLELVLLVGFLDPLSIRRNPDVVATDHPLATVLGTDLSGALRFIVPVLGAFGLYALAAWLARGLAGRGVLALVLLGTLGFSLILLPTNPVAAHDAYYHIANARTLWVYGGNPTTIPPNAYPDDPFYPHVPAWQDFASAYGPVWYALSGAPIPFAGARLWPNVIGLKTLTAIFLLGATALAMLVSDRIRPGTAAAAGVLVGWNPLLQFETAGNAHNDIVVAAFALAALYALTRRWWLAVFPLLALSVATKYVLVLLGPLLLVWMLRQRDVPRRQTVLSLMLGALVGAAVYAPFFAGAETLASFRRQANLYSSSPSAFLATALRDGLGFDWTIASNGMKLLVVPPFLIAYAWLMLRIWRNADMVTLVRAGFWTVFLLLTLVTWWFWPWYLAFLAPLAALLPGSRPALVAGVFSASAMLMYVPHFWLLEQNRLVFDAASAATAFLLPVLVAVAPRLQFRTQRRPREAPAAD